MVWWSLVFVLWFANVHHAIVAGRWGPLDEDALITGLGIWAIAVLLSIYGGMAATNGDSAFRNTGVSRSLCDCAQRLCGRQGNPRWIAR